MTVQSGNLERFDSRKLVQSTCFYRLRVFHRLSRRSFRNFNFSLFLHSTSNRADNLIAFPLYTQESHAKKLHTPELRIHTSITLNKDTSIQKNHACTQDPHTPELHAYTQDLHTRELHRYIPESQARYARIDADLRRPIDLHRSRRVQWSNWP